MDSILHYLAAQGNAPDFVLCIGDDRSDEDMFTAMEHVTFSPHLPAEVSLIVTPINSLRVRCAHLSIMHIESACGHSC